jgi:hypothetical protein
MSSGDGHWSCGIVVVTMIILIGFVTALILEAVAK